jgi:hypothetical protein
MNKKLLMQICENEYERVEKNIDNQIEKLQRMKLLCKVVRFANEFSQHLAGDDELFSDFSKHYGKKITLSFGYEQKRIPNCSSVFYTLDGKKDSFNIEDGEEFLVLLRLADEGKRRYSNEMVIDHAFAPRLIMLILGEKIMEQYADACMEIGIMV